VNNRLPGCSHSAGMDSLLPANGKMLAGNRIIRETTMVRPKKHLGQHFLTDPGIAERITGSLTLEHAQALLEIGPGKGVLTQFLKGRDDIDFYLVEIDNEAVEFLRKEYPALGDHLIGADFLRLDLSQFGERVAIIGNFPYNISSQIFFKVLDNRDRVPEVVGMIQKEVAERLISGPGTKRYGILSVFLQAWYNISYLFTVNPGSFFPPPKVKSSVIRLERNGRTSLGCDEALFRRVVKTAFNQRRKMMRNSLASLLVNLDREDPVFTRRPEELGVEEFIRLTQKIESQNTHSY